VHSLPDYPGPAVETTEDLPDQFISDYKLSQRSAPSLEQEKCRAQTLMSGPNGLSRAGTPNSPMPIRSRTRKTISSSTSASEPPVSGPVSLVRLVLWRLLHYHGYAFDSAIGVVILMSSVSVGVEIQCDLEGNVNCSRRTHNLEHVFLVVFIFELFIRAFGDGSSILKSGWFRFDAVLVAIGVISSWVIEPIVWNVLASDGYRASVTEEQFLDILSQVLILRVLRLLRLVRALRLFEQFQEMWKLANGLVCSLRTVLSACVLIVLTVYIFACLGIELITRNQLLLEDPETAALIQSHIPSIQITMLTLIQFCNADSIGAVYRPLVERASHLVIYFGFVWLVVTIKLMNLITAVIVDKAISQGDVDRDLELAVKRKRWRILEPYIRDIFMELDQYNAGELSLSDFRSGLDSMKAAYKKSLPADLRKILDSDQLVELYEYLDVDGSGAVDEKEFTDGIFTLVLQSVPIETTQMLHLLRSNSDMLQRIQRKMPSPSCGQSSMEGSRENRPRSAQPEGLAYAAASF